jgi:CubicO group peptidase (beta-lactamase class C family)
VKWVDSLPAEWSGLTIHQLLRHTSGISDYEEWFDGYTTQAYSDYMSQAHAPERIVRDARSKPLDHQPGTTFRYSNSAYIVLGYIIERASGMPYDEFLRQRIHGPLGMALSDQDRSELLVAHRAQGYRLRPGAYPMAYFNGLRRGDWHNAVYQLMEPPQADAGLLTTARDLYKWDQALYTERLVKRVSLDSIFTPGIGDYGYGWFVRSGPDGRTHEHSGGLPGYSAYIMRIPETHRTVIVLNNIERSGPIHRDLATILRGEPVATPRARHIVPNDTALDAGRAGMYRNAAGDSVRVFMENGNMGIHQPGQFRVGLLSEGGTEYFSPQLRGVVSFTGNGSRTTVTVRDALGNVVIVAERSESSP